MMRNKVVIEKRLELEATGSQAENCKERPSRLPKSAMSSNKQTVSSDTSAASRTSVSFSSTSSHHSYATRSRSKSSVSYAETNKANNLPNIIEGPNISVKHLNTAQNLSSSLINAFQMPQNFAQAFPNINMSSLPEYLSQLPSVSMPAMPIISIPNITMPSMPSLSMPSMPNLSMPNITMPSMPSIPSIPNINIPSISDIMNFPGRRNIKSWNQICIAVRDSRKRFTDVCPSLPFSFNFRYDYKKEKLRIYFLSSHNSPETTLYYCDVSLVKQPKSSEKNHATIFGIDEDEDLNMSSYIDNNINDVRNDMIQKTNNRHRNENGETNTRNENDNETEQEDYEMEHNLSTKSSSIPSLSSSASSGSFAHVDPTLLRKSVTSPTSSIPDFETLDWKPLILMNRNYYAFNEDSSEFVQSKQAKSDGLYPNKACSREEDLILQRKRILFNGVVSYDFNPQAARFVFTIKNMIYWFDDLEIAHTPNFSSFLNDSSEADSQDLNVPSHLSASLPEKFPSPPPYIPHKLMTNTFVKMNATMCPHNPDIVAYLADNDLWVCDLVSCKEQRLTFSDYMKTGVMAGRPSFVMQEEFARFNGFWWRPRSNEDDSQIYTILCEFVDESVVDVVSLSSWDGTSEFHRFPKAGCCNAKSELKLVKFSLNDLKTLSKANNNSSFLKIEELPVSFKSLFPLYEYLIRCDWYSSDVIWAQLLNREQSKLVIVFISITHQFPPQIIYEESRENHWFNCHDVLYFYQSVDESDSGDTQSESNLDDYHLTVGSNVRFLWSSESTGYRHLYKVTIEIAGLLIDISDDKVSSEADTSQCTSDDSQVDHNNSAENLAYVELKSKLISNQQITNGNWEVSESMFWVDEEKDLIYFIGSKDSPLESHLYVVSSSQSSRVLPRRLTKEDFTHSRVFFDPEFKFCLDFQSNLTIPPFGYFHKVVQPEHASHLVNLDPMAFFLGIPEEVTYDESLEYYDKVQSLGPTPQLFEYKLESGELIYGFLFKPDFMEPGVKYPVLLEIYGGPEVQLVTKSFKDVRQHRRHLIASEGYIVVGFDSRGSKHRGVDFERYIYKRLGQVEVNDQVEALEWLAQNTGFIDMNRVAVHGWSYGGYLSLMALAQRPDIFKCSIAGAPVTNWMLYDTGYTERYMGLPDENEEGYRMSSILSYIKHFPDEYNRLLIIHGLMDENVHFAHTAQLINALIMAGKPYNLNVFPSERHSLRKIYSSEHYEATLLHYLQQNL